MPEASTILNRQIKVAQMTYRHLTQDERYQIVVLKQVLCTQQEIARRLGRSPSTISRELRRNRNSEGYDPGQAHQFAQARMRACANARRISEQTWAYARERLLADWSPEQIAGRLVLEGGPTVSPETLYQRILADKRAGGTLYRHLRCQKGRRKRYGGPPRKDRIPGRVWIDERPKLVNRRKRYGDWELDLVVGAGQRGALVRAIERKSRFSLMAQVANKRASVVSETLIRLLAPFKNRVHTLTSDNGPEFAWHARIARELNAKVYFAHPYSAWERGTIENNNGLVRQYFPKSMPLDSINSENVDHATHRLNNRPRKCLGFLTPHEAFLGNATLSSNNVALRT